MENLRQQFELLNSPEELLDFMKKNIRWGWTGKDGITVRKTEDFKEQYQLSDIDQLLTAGRGCCFDQVELERYFFIKHNIPHQTYAIVASHIAHTFLIFERDGIYYKFEHSNVDHSGIFPFNSELELLKSELERFISSHKIKNVSRLSLVAYDPLPPHIDAQGIKKILTQCNTDLISTIINNSSSTGRKNS